MLQLKVFDSATPVRRAALQHLAHIAPTIDWKGLTKKGSQQTTDDHASSEEADKGEGEQKEPSIEQNAKKVGDDDVLFDAEWAQRILSMAEMIPSVPSLSSLGANRPTTNGEGNDPKVTNPLYKTQLQKDIDHFCTYFF